MFLTTVAVIWGIAAVTPGPNFLVVARCALTGARRVALAAVAGTILGTLTWGLAGWLGISALFAAAPAAYFTLKILGGAYICWLGIRLLCEAWRPAAKPAVTVRPRAISPRRAFRLGFSTNIANPKSAVFVASVFAAALPADYHWTQGLASVAVMVAISACWYSIVALSLSSEPIGSVYLKARRAVDAAAGTIFLGFGTRMMLAQR